MQLDRYQIVRAGAYWAIQLNASTLRTFAKRRDAIKAAIEAALQSGESGNAAEVMAQGRDGNLVPLWTFGRDAYSSETVSR
ncbi:hypothetical protein ACFOYU_08020 [Microvirga sp. GCM10011540]|uniref:hypothetical protein n=1 Tax=Microvirga sp. GCM10011540 TaxID=3317338 RepID=UPI003619E8BE